MKLSHLDFYKSPVPASFLPRRQPNGPVFDSKELNRMINEHHELVRKNGYSLLTVPPSLHPIRTDMLSKRAKYVADKLTENGFRAYLCGGGVRDFLQNRTVNDFDFVTDASNEDLRAVFSDILFHQIPSGHEFGYIDFGDEIVDVCRMTNIPAEYEGLKNIPEFDSSKLYSDNLLFDGLQRDFTINSLYYDIESGNIIDWFGGLYDLREGLISTAVAPSIALRSDARTALRALRFEARFGFSLSEELDEAIRKEGCDLIAKIPPQTIAIELPAFFSGGFAYSGACLLLEYGLFSLFFPASGEMVNTASYREYVKKTAYGVDWIFDEGTIGLPLLAMAAFLWPAVSRYRREGVSDAERLVLNSQREVMTMSDEDAEFMLDALRIDENSERILDNVVTIFEKPDFEDALEMLRIHYLMNSDKLL